MGKTSTCLRYMNDQFTESVSTIGIDFLLKGLQTEWGMIKFQLWDTAGEERFRTFRPGYYRGAHLIFFVYDITKLKKKHF